MPTQVHGPILKNLPLNWHNRLNKQVAPKVEYGDTTIFSGSVIHGGPATEERLVYLMCFAVKGLPPNITILDYPYYNERYAALTCTDDNGQLDEARLRKIFETYPAILATAYHYQRIYYLKLLYGKHYMLKPEVQKMCAEMQPIMDRFYGKDAKVDEFQPLEIKPPKSTTPRPSRSRDDKPSPQPHTTKRRSSRLQEKGEQKTPVKRVKTEAASAPTTGNTIDLTTASTTQPSSKKRKQPSPSSPAATSTSALVPTSKKSERSNYLYGDVVLAAGKFQGFTFVTVRFLVFCFLLLGLHFLELLGQHFFLTRVSLLLFDIL